MLATGVEARVVIAGFVRALTGLERGDSNVLIGLNKKAGTGHGLAEELETRRAEMVEVFEGIKAFKDTLKPLVELEVRMACAVSLGLSYRSLTDCSSLSNCMTHMQQTDLSKV